MKSLRLVSISLALVCALECAPALAQSPSVLYTWDNSGNAVPNIESWIKGFGPNSVTLDNTTPGTLTITEMGGAGASVAISDGFNRVRESSTAASGGTDLTGLDFLEFDLGHTGAGTINVQFYVQATTSSTFVALGPDLAVGPAPATYQVPLSGLTPDQIVYVRTMGYNARDHAALGDVVWSLTELRSGGTPLLVRDLITHDTGTAEGGLQGAIVNFDNAAVLGNDGGQNQTGLSHNPAGSGSLQWTDVGGQNGAAMSWGNGTAWNGNTFNNRTTDLSNYREMIVRISATDPTGGGGEVGLNAFFQKNNFSFQNAEGGAGRNLPIDGQFHELSWSLAGLTNMNVVDLTGINLFSHPQDLIINVDNIRFIVPEPASLTFLAMAFIGCCGMMRRVRR